jgi:hypothetical protein
MQDRRRFGLRSQGHPEDLVIGVKVSDLDVGFDRLDRDPPMPQGIASSIVGGIGDDSVRHE